MGRLRDPRYKNVHNAIVAGYCTCFREIFEHIPKTTVARDLGKNSGRMDMLIETPNKLTFDDICHLSELIEVHIHKTVDLIKANGG